MSLYSERVLITKVHWRLSVHLHRVCRGKWGYNYAGIADGKDFPLSFLHFIFSYCWITALRILRPAEPNSEADEEREKQVGSIHKSTVGKALADQLFR